MKTLTIKLDTEQAAQILIAAAAAYPMGLVAHINGQANCAKRGIQVPADQILEIFRPDFAVRVWKAEKQAGFDIPLRIHLYDSDGKTKVAFRTAQEIFAPYGNQELNRIAGELDEIFDQLLSALKPHEMEDAA